MMKTKETYKLLENYNIMHINNVNLFASIILLIASFGDTMVQIKEE